MIDRISANDIIKYVSYGIGVTEYEMKSNSRVYRIVTARHTAIHLIRKYTTMKLGDIAMLFHRDHSTAVHAINNVEAWQKYSKPYRLLLQGIEANIRGVCIDSRSS